MAKVFYLDDEAETAAERAHVVARVESLPDKERDRMHALMRIVGRQPLSQAGDGWRKVTVGRGGPDWSHRSVPVGGLVRELDDVKLSQETKP